MFVTGHLTNFSDLIIVSTTTIMVDEHNSLLYSKFIFIPTGKYSYHPLSNKSLFTWNKHHHRKPQLNTIQRLTNHEDPKLNVHIYITAAGICNSVKIVNEGAEDQESAVKPSFLEMAALARLEKWILQSSTPQARIWATIHCLEENLPCPRMSHLIEYSRRSGQPWKQIHTNIKEQTQ